MSTWSIIIPALDEGAIISSLLTDLQPFRHQGAEIILVDGGSQDNTCDQATPLVDRLIKTRAGRGYQQNQGALVAKGDCLWFLHADCRVPQGAILSLQALNDFTWGRFNIRLDAPSIWFRLIERMINWRSCLTGMATGDQGIFVRAGSYHQVGGFQDIALMEDLVLSQALRRSQQPHCIKSPLITSARRWQKKGVIKTVLLMWRLRLAWFLGVSPTRLARHYTKCTSPECDQTPDS